MCKEYLKNKKGSVTLLPFQEHFLIMGDIFNIELKENHFSSFRWHLAEYDPGMVSLILKKKIDPYSNDIMGHKKIVLWQFRALDTGKTKLIFELYRPWEGISTSVERLVYDVTVNRSL